MSFSGYQNAELLKRCGTHSRLLVETSMNQRKQGQEVKQEGKEGKTRKASTSTSWQKGR